MDCLRLGSSPRMRGTPKTRPFRDEQFRIIPAHAGNTPVSRSSACTNGDHPRACGEHVSHIYVPDVTEGSSPRMRGTLCIMALCKQLCRIIPAHAGNTLKMSALRLVTEDHPRACGEHPASLCQPVFGIGSSPRMRGTLILINHTYYSSRIIPAHAGNTRKRG